MRKILFTFTLLLGLAAISFAQTQEKTTQKKESLNKEWQDVVEEMEEALEDIEIPDIDIDRILQDVKEAMPSKDEMESYKEIARDAVSELRKIDLSELEEALAELREELSDIFEDHRDRDRDRDEDRKKGDQ